MTETRRGVGVMVALVASLLFVTHPSESQVLPDCYAIGGCVAPNLEWGDEMAAEPNELEIGGTPEPTFHHTECLVCDEDDGENGVCHYSCGESEDEEQQENEQLAHLDAFRAFLRDDLPEIIAQAPQLGSYLYWNEARGSLQLLACTGGSVIASIRVDESAREVIAWARQHLSDIGEHWRNRSADRSQLPSP